MVSFGGKKGSAAEARLRAAAIQPSLGVDVGR